jgi:hypothetical protein
VRHLPFLSICITKKDTSRRGLERGERVRGVNLLREEVRLGEDDCRDLWIIGMVCCAAKIGGFEDWSVLVKEALMVAEMVGEDLKVVADVWDALGTVWVSDGVAVDCDGDGSFRSHNVSNIHKMRVVRLESNPLTAVSISTSGNNARLTRRFHNCKMGGHQVLELINIQLGINGDLPRRRGRLPKEMELLARHDCCKS